VFFQIGKHFCDIRNDGVGLIESPAQLNRRGEPAMTALLYVIFICNAGGACTQANDDAMFSSPQECLRELPQLYYGSLQRHGKFYIRDQSRDTWLECVGMRPDDDRIVWSSTNDRKGLSSQKITEGLIDAERRLQQSLILLSDNESR
jgi:hypothetical protein